MSEALTEALERLKDRMNELRPAHEEYLELDAFFQRQAVDREQAAAPAAAAPAAPAMVPRTPTRQRPVSSQTTPVPANQGATVAKIQEIVSNHPEGISVKDIIDEGQLSTSYTYDVVKRLVDQGALEKRNRKIFLGGTRGTRQGRIASNGNDGAVQEPATAS